MQRVTLDNFSTAAFCAPTQFLADILGSQNYVAPDVMQCRYNCKADIWSLGILFHVLLCGRLPFDARQAKQVLQDIANGAALLLILTLMR